MTTEINTSGVPLAIFDCNAMYVSTHMIFEPWKAAHPAVVLSVNDGNIVARSAEAKRLGITMGQPWHEVAPLYRAGKLYVYSANFVLYQSISDRIMTLLAREAGRVSPYSVDEAWVSPPPISGDLEPWGREIRASIMKQIGMPMGVGIGTTKTMAKLANWAAKKWAHQTGNVVDIRLDDRLEKLLKAAPVGEIWGIGPRLTKRLESDLRITSAWQLAMADKRLLRRHFGVTVERTARELCGERCFDFEDDPVPQQTIISSQSFGQKVQDKEVLASAVATYVARGAAKLRRQGSLTHCLSVFARTSPFARTGEPYSASQIISFNSPTSDTRDLTAAAMEAVDRIYRPGVQFAKAGIQLSQFVPAKNRTDDLFAPGQRPESPAVMSVMDDINRKMGRGAVRVARAGAQHGWEMKRQFASPHYTTRWEDLPVAR
ncbi:DUF4113 domain-containing protein [Halomonas sp. I5-271120]|uniref:DUF4113 domain-containing protein n=1 Tax=Halomonas sp. I5-271120 TaxID=3061632 RepID=UPI0027154263|nr:DUF4113 domain-containing protein [Halomonas sp. I5-271120]